MGRLEPPFTYSQPLWWLAQTTPTGWAARRLWGGGGWGVAGNLWGDGVWGGAAWGDGAWCDGVWGGAEPWGGWPWYQGTLAVEVADAWGAAGVWGDNLWGDSRPHPNPYIGVGLATGFGPDDWGDNDPTFGVLEGAPRYAVFGGGSCALADGTTVFYHDASGLSGTVGIAQGSVGVKHCLNTTGTSGTYTDVAAYIGCYAVKPVWPGNRRFRLIYRWVASSVGWYDWDGVTVPGGASLFTLTTDLDDTGCGTAWPTVTGHWPASGTSGGVTSPCPASGSFTVHT